MATELFTAADQYIDRLFPEDGELALAAKFAAAAGLHDMSVSHNQGRFLYLLARLCNAKRILELGTFMGYSTLWLAKSLTKDGTIVTIEYDASHAALAQQNFTQAALAATI